MWWWQTQFKVTAVCLMIPSLPLHFLSEYFLMQTINCHRMYFNIKIFLVMLHHGFRVGSAVFFLFFVRPHAPPLICLSIFINQPVLCCWILSPCYILFTLIKTLSFTGTQSAWVSLTHLTMVTVQCPVYILACTHRPLSFHSCEGHRWRKEGEKGGQISD